MSIASEIQRIKTNIANAYTQANEKGATLPEQQNSANLASTIESISSGGGLNIQHGIIPKAVDEDGYIIEKEVVGLTELSNYVMYNYYNNSENIRLKKVTLPSNLTKIGSAVFDGCTELDDINIPSTLQEIGNYAFRNTKISRITLPASLKNNYDAIGRYTFYGCNELEEISITQNNDYVKVVDGALCLKNYYTSSGRNFGISLINKYPPKRNAKSCSIESVASSVLDGAFENATQLETITLNLSKGPSTMQNYMIFSQAFYNCTNLEKLILKTTAQVISLNNVNAFTGTKIANGEGYIFVPDALLSNYKSATNWSTFANQIKPLSELE